MGEFKFYGKRAVRPAPCDADAFMRFGISRATIGFRDDVGDELVGRLGDRFAVGVDVGGKRIMLVPDLNGFKVATHNAGGGQWMWTPKDAVDDLTDMFDACANDNVLYPMSVDIREDRAILSAE